MHCCHKGDGDHDHQPEVLIQGRMGPYFLCCSHLNLNFETKLKTPLLLSNERFCSLYILFLVDRSDTY